MWGLNSLTAIAKRYRDGRLIFIHLRCWEVLLFLTIQHQRCIKILFPEDPEFHTPLALNCQKERHLSALEVYKNESLRRALSYACVSRKKRQGKQYRNWKLRWQQNTTDSSAVVFLVQRGPLGLCVCVCKRNNLCPELQNFMVESFGLKVNLFQRRTKSTQKCNTPENAKKLTVPKICGFWPYMLVTSGIVGYASFPRKDSYNASF